MNHKKNSLNILPILYIFIFAWIAAGILIALPNYQAIWQLTRVNTYNQDTKNALLYGADYLAYQKLAQTPGDTKIIYLVPDDYYWPKSIFFLYPREIKIIHQPSEINNIDINQYQYVLIYLSIPQFTGYIQGMFKEQKNWKINELFNLHNELNPDNPLNTQPEFEDLLIKQKGVLLYKL